MEQTGDFSLPGGTDCTEVEPICLRPLTTDQYPKGPLPAGFLTLPFPGSLEESDVLWAAFCPAESEQLRPQWRGNELRRQEEAQCGISCPCAPDPSLWVPLSFLKAPVLRPVL